MKLVPVKLFSHTAAITLASLLLAMTARGDAVSATAGNGAQAMLDAARQTLEAHWASHSDRIEIEMATVDPRLQIPVCQVPLDSSLNTNSVSSNGGRVTVRVSCQDSAPWTRHVAAQVRVFREVAVSARALARGERVQSADIMLEERDISLFRGQIMASLEPAIGQSLRRSLRPGEVLTLDILEAPTLVKRGDAVVLRASRGAVSIRHTGTALQDGQQGRQIPVRNNRSGRVVQAVVVAEGEAEVVF